MKNSIRRAGLFVGVALLLLPISINTARAAEKYPFKPLTCISPNAAGSDADVLFRPLMERASGILGRPIMIVNKPGAGMTIGYRVIHEAKADGYTIGTGTGTLVSNKLQGLMPFDYHDFTLIATYAIYVPVIVTSNRTPRPFKSIQEAIAFAKAHPGDVSIATSFVGGVWWIATMYFQESSGLKFNVIPQPAGGADTITQVAGGHTDLGILATGAARGQVDAGNATVLASYSLQRLPGKYQHVPTLKEVGYDITFESPQMVLGPPGMPKNIVEQLVKIFKEAANHPDYVKFIENQNAIPLYLTPEQTLNRLEEQRKVYRAIMEKAGVLKEKG